MVAAQPPATSLNQLYSLPLLLTGKGDSSGSTSISSSGGIGALWQQISALSTRVSLFPGGPRRSFTFTDVGIHHREQQQKQQQEQQQLVAAQLLLLLLYCKKNRPLLRGQCSCSSSRGSYIPLGISHQRRHSVPVRPQWEGVAHTP